MKTTLVSCALLLSVLAVNAQSDNLPADKAGKVNEKKEAKVRIKKVENINGVETVTDTTYTVSDASEIKWNNGSGTEVINIDEKGDGKKKVMVITDSQTITSDSPNGETKVRIIEGGEGMDAEIEKALKEAGVDPKDCKGGKKMVIVNEDTEGGKAGEEKKVTKIVMIRMNMTDASPEDMKRLTNIGKADNKLEIEEIKMYPNPHDGKFKLNFSLTNKGDAKVSIFNVEGKEVYSEKLPNFTGEYNKDIDISSNKKGVYFVKIEQGAHAQVKKVVLE